MHREPPTGDMKHAEAQAKTRAHRFPKTSCKPCDLIRYIDDLHLRLQSNPPARVADIGCGSGESSIGMAQAYPSVRVDGYDMDVSTIDQAWANAHQASLTDRVTFHLRDVGDGTLNGRYELVTATGSVLHMANPVGVLKVMRRLAGKDGSVVVVVEHRSGSALEHYAREAGFHRAEVFPIPSGRFDCYRLRADMSLGTDAVGK